jgi:hypothetical protein
MVDVLLKSCVYYSTVKTEKVEIVLCVALDIVIIEKEITTFQMFHIGVPYQSVLASFHNLLVYKII